MTGSIVVNKVVDKARSVVLNFLYFVFWKQDCTVSIVVDNVTETDESPQANMVMKTGNTPVIKERGCGISDCKPGILS